MITLDYRTNNPRWGLSGVHFDSWDGYALTLGLLANARHYKGYETSPHTLWSGSISVHIERNNDQGAWDKEGRIHYYKDIADLEINFEDLYNCKSAGNKSTTCRINSNEYVYSLLQEYGFTVSYTDVLPPNSDVKFILKQKLKKIGLTPSEIESALEQYDLGWNA